MILDKVVIKVYSSYITVNANPYGRIYPDVFLQDTINFLTKYIWKKVQVSPRYWTNKKIETNRYFRYDEMNECFVFPRHILTKIEKMLEEKKVPREDIEIEYMDPIEPAKTEVRVLSTWTDRPAQVPVIDHLSRMCESMSATNMTPGAGKMQPNDSLVRVPSGWKKIGSLKVGDKVIAWDGNVVTVTGVFPQGLRSIYRITTKDGGVTHAGRDHLWGVLVRDSKSETGFTMRIRTTEELSKQLNSDLPTHKKRVYIPSISPLQDTDISLPIHPYLIGAIISKGSVGKTGKLKLEGDLWICEYATKLLPKNYTSIITKDPSKKSPYSRQCNVTFVDESISKISGNRDLHDHLCALKMAEVASHDRFIPDLYMRGSHTQRMELLRGLMDTSGSTNVDKRGNPTTTVHYYTSSARLAKDVQMLVRSLGGFCGSRLRHTKYNAKYGDKKYGRPSYVLTVKFEDPSSVFRLPRKKMRVASSYTTDPVFKNEIISVEHTRVVAECTCISIDHPDRLYITDDFIVTHNTYSAIKSACNLGYVTMIVVGGLVEQWRDNYIEKTNIDPNKIFVVQGSKSLIELMTSENFYDVIIWSLQTLRNYVTAKEEPYSSLPPYDEFLKHFGVGTIIRDEFHLFLDTNIKVDLASNVKHNLYLSATPSRSDEHERGIFKAVYPNSIINGRNKVEKYINSTAYLYRLYNLKPSKYKTPQGYSQVKFETILLRNPNYYKEFFSVVNLALQEGHINKVKRHKPFKTLIFCATIDMCNRLTKSIMELYSDLSISTFTSNDKDDVIEQYDVLVTTIKKCGVGRDIKGLGSVINTHNTRNYIALEQLVGRLRFRDDIPLDIYDVSVVNCSVHKTIADRRFMFYRDNCKTFNKINQ